MVSFARLTNKHRSRELIQKKHMAAKEKNTPKENIQQEDENIKDKQQKPATPIPPQRTNPNAKPASDEEESKEKE